MMMSVREYKRVNIIYLEDEKINTILQEKTLIMSYFKQFSKNLA